MLYNYEVAQKAARDSARYLSSVPAMHMKSAALVAQEVALATAITQTELSALAPAPGGLLVFISCDGVPCTGLFGNVPNIVTTTVMIDVQNEFYGYAGDLPRMQVRASHSMRYVGN